MRKIESDMIAAIREGREFNRDNTAVYWLSASETGNPYGARAEIYLHGNLIAEYWPQTGELFAMRPTFERWPTATTRSRLRALGFSASISKGEAVLENDVITNW